jgi:hypothetical protein
VKLEEPIAIDDTSIMAKLREIVRMQPHGAAERQRLVLSLLASSFFFELDCAPKFDAGFYRCEGSIRCRNQIGAITDTIGRIFPSAVEFVTDSVTLATFEGARGVCALCLRFRKPVVFYVRHPSETITMYLRVDQDIRTRISGFPQSMSWFIRQQQLDTPFGVPSHSVPGSVACSRCRIAEVSLKRHFSSQGDTARKRTRLQ